MSGTTSTTQTNPPDYIRPYLEWMLSQSRDLAAQNQMPRYVDAAGNPIQRVAGPGYDTQSFYSGVRGLATSPHSDLISARNTFAQAAEQAGSLANYEPGRIDLNYAPATLDAMRYQSQYQPGAYHSRSSGVSFDPTNYQAGQINSGYAGPAAYRAGSFSTDYTPASMQGLNLESSYRAPQSYQAAQLSNAYNPDTGYRTATFSSGYTPSGQYQGFQDGNYDRVSAGQGDVPFLFDTATADRYMSPYMQRVVDVQKDAAIRDFNIDRARRNDLAVQANAYGGSRQAIQESLANESLMRRLDNIQATGTQSAFENAQGQAERDRNAMLGVQSMNIGNSLQADFQNQAARQAAASLGEQSRQFGAGFGEGQQRYAADQRLQEQQLGEDSRRFASDLAERQAQFRAQNTLSREQIEEASRQFGAQFDDSAQREQAERAMRAQLEGYQTRLSAAQFGEQSRQAMNNLGLGAFQANEAANQFGARFADDGQRYASDSAMRAQIANEQARLAGAAFGDQSRLAAANIGLQAFGADEASRQFGAQFGDAGQRYAADLALRAGQMTDASRLAAAQFGEQSRMNAANTALNMFGANEGARMAAAQNALNATGMLGQQGGNFANLGSLFNTLQRDNLGMLGGIGQQQDANYQTRLDLGYNDWLQQNAFPRENMSFFSNILRGMPVQNQTQTFGGYQPTNTMSSIFGAGLTGLGLYNMMGRM